MAVMLCASSAQARPSDAHPLEAVRIGIDRLAAQGRFSGDILIAHHGRTIFQRAYGLADRRTGKRNDLLTRFNLASVGKSFTAVAIARLVQSGQLRFTDKIASYLPELPGRVTRNITVAELLDHTSGIGDFFASPEYGALRPRLTSLKRYLPLIRDEPAGPAGTFTYSNSGYILLGLIIERVSHQSYYTFLQHAVFDRAGMTHSGCFPSEHLPRDTAIGYRGNAARPNTGGLPPRGSSAGGCYSTTGDLLKFINALEINRLVNASLTRALSTPKIRLKGAQSYGFGFGLRNGPPPELPTIWHNGGSPGVGAEFDLNRGSGYAVIVLSNLDYPIIQPAIDLILNKLQIP